MVRIFQDLEALSLGAAKLFVGRVKETVEKRGKCSVVLAGGQTPRRTYELLARPPFRDQVNWRRIKFFWGDERCVPPDDSRSNFKMACECFLNHVPVPAEGIHPISCDENPSLGAENYEKFLKRHFSGRRTWFDLIFLGLGENGHTASLFPELEVLKIEDRWVSDVRVAGEDFCRVTLTAWILNQASYIVFLVSGLSKAPVLREVLEGPRDPYRLPAQLVNPIDGKTIWLLDQDAASQLKGWTGKQ